MYMYTYIHICKYTRPPIWLTSCITTFRPVTLRPYVSLKGKNCVYLKKKSFCVF